MSQSTPIKIYYSYAQDDQSLWDDLMPHLKGLENCGKIKGASLEQAEIILLFISKYFLATEHCYQIVMKRALQRREDKEAIVIPVKLGRCRWDGHPFAALSHLPEGGESVEDKKVWLTPDDAYLNIVDGIAKVVTDIRAGKIVLRPPSNPPVTNSDTDFLPKISHVDPKLLPYLCDRRPQEEKLGEAVRELPSEVFQPLICVIEGEEDECHPEFQDRLYKVNLPAMLKPPAENKVSAFYMPWPESHAQGSAQDIFYRQLAPKVLGPGWSTKPVENCFTTLAISTPALVIVDLYARQWSAQTPALIEKFFTFWNECAAMTLPWKGRLIVGLFIRYPTLHDLKFWQFLERNQREEINERVRQYWRDARWDFSAIKLKILPELSGVKLTDVNELLTDDIVTSNYDHLGLLNAIPSLYTREELLKSGDRISMSKVGKALEEMFPKYRKTT